MLITAMEFFKKSKSLGTPHTKLFMTWSLSYYALSTKNENNTHKKYQMTCTSHVLSALSHLPLLECNLHCYCCHHHHHHFLNIKDGLIKDFVDMKIIWLFNKFKLKFVFMYSILFGIHHYDLIVLEIRYRIFFLIISQLHKDNNTAVEDQRRKKTDIFIYNFLYCKHLVYILLLTYNERALHRQGNDALYFYSYSAIAYYNRISSFPLA